MKACQDCGICCLETEMFLSNSDIKRILKKYSDFYEIKNFAKLTKYGFYQLRNINHHCFFFDPETKKCKIYDVRPKGCRFYPLIYNLEFKKCILDKLCPNRELFYETSSELRKNCIKLRKFIEKELGISLNQK